MTANPSSENPIAAASTPDVRGSGLSVASGSPSAETVKRAEEYVETFCSLTDNSVGEISTRLHAAVLLHEMRRYRTAIQNCVEWSNGREYEWGDRAENAFAFLHAALANAVHEPRAGESPSVPSAE